ncbi:Protein kinase superfamily protein [Raphanus sativus]|uniref:Probable serine/threonine-protein kinase At1g09600 n=1 Tax=Raphanus sativus TaxID=3726 RepID=A0A6J0KBQ1_RAPSA|nr:probable serine/threonine-protein kinase At1g09600 [Raphanus sativus]KAJ4873274.1 Protein kinase superfamily protein [Raphanus sativus]
MGCICATARTPTAAVANNELLNSSKSTLHLISHPPSSSSSLSKKEGSFTRPSSVSSITVVANGHPVARRPSSTSSDRNSNKPVATVGAPSRNHSRRVTAMQVVQQSGRLTGNKTETAEWPSWLASVAGEAIKGWVPRYADSYEKLDKIGQGTYSSVYKARDLETGKVVAMKKVRFVNMDPESVKFMAREILILRKLDHPNVMKLEGLVTSRLSGSLYLVFEYMEHDLAGLAATPGIKFSETQIKCYMQQLFRGLEHCHRRGILHRDIKGSNLLINNEGVLKIGDFGLANFYKGDGDLQLTSRVVTLWYRAPELLLGATEYGPAIDLWSAGCILTELFAGKPIMPGRTEVEQMHKIFKLCGSPLEDYWKRATLPLATSFKPSHPYKAVLAETFSHFPASALTLINKLLAIEPERRGSAASALRSEFFTTEPLPADPSNLPRYQPSKELDAKLRNEEARKLRAEDKKRRRGETVTSGQPRDVKTAQTPELTAAGQSKVTCISHKFKTDEEGGTGFRIEPPRRGGSQQNGHAQASSVVHPSVADTEWNRGGSIRRQTNAELKSRIVQTGNLSGDSCRGGSNRDYSAGNAPMKNRIVYSGPLMPPGGNLEEMLKEHEKQIQHAVRRARVENYG